ncbi:amidohydrolase [Falsibacillus albus]|uniref:Amidohydrolase n=1 Tax=Falsibacillus albus TaxID=2478915 RepID=A0A3L7K708_9BACI|nr:amidohydrolase [Falsibacillus albus]RLQ97931.1 amidohydrolase [Falsibacillus albus]
MGTLFFNGTIYTMLHEGETTEAVFCENGWITEIGSFSELQKKYESKITKQVDLNEGIMYPGFIDSHMHLIGHGETLIRLDLSEVQSKEELMQLLMDRAKLAEAGEWIIGEGWNENLWDNQTVPTRFDLDEAVPDHPVLLKRICRHAICVNTKALKEASINDQSQSPTGGVIERDEMGRINGVLKDQAQELIFSVMPSVSDAYLEHALRAGIENCWRFGLVGGHTEDLNYYGGMKRTIEAFTKVIKEEQRKFKANLLIHHEVIEEWQQDRNIYENESPYIEFGAMKIFADGALGGRTALLSHPYGDDPATNGVAIHTYEDLLGLVQKARSYGLPVAVHTIGDLAFELVLDAIESIPVPSGKRDRLIHAQILRADLIERAKRLPIVLDIQPRFVASDFPWVIDRIGEQNMAYNYAWRTLIHSGIHCAGGSDAPIEPINPLLGIYEAVSRAYFHKNEKSVHNPKEKLSVYEAISLFTKGGAYAVHHENFRGEISRGFTADFTVLDKDLFSIDEDEIPQTKVLMTVVDEEIVYQADL